MHHQAEYRQDEQGQLPSPSPPSPAAPTAHTPTAVTSATLLPDVAGSAAALAAGTSADEVFVAEEASRPAGQGAE